MTLYLSYRHQLSEILEELISLSLMHRGRPLKSRPHEGRRKLQIPLWTSVMTIIALPFVKAFGIHGPMRQAIGSGILPGREHARAE